VVDQPQGKPVANVLEKLGARLSASVSSAHLNIRGVAYDSRKVQPGFAFFCIDGEHVDGNSFIPEAIKSGASLIVTEKAPADPAVACAVVPDVRKALADIAAEFYGNPVQKLRLLGVTGTNGKTTTTHLLEVLFNDAGLKTGLIGTLGARIGPQEEYSEAKHTTPQSADLQRVLASMVENGCRYVAMEVSSHALAQQRVGGCEFACAVLTNITQDHLDYHKTMDHYWRSKRLLFEGLEASTKENKTAVLNFDDPLFSTFDSVCHGDARVISYGWNAPADIHVLACNFTTRGTDLTLQTPAAELVLKLKLAGKFNVYNVMAAVGVCIAEGIALDTIKTSLDAFRGVAGRFEVVSTGAEFEPLCIVDYAHTPDGLDNVLRTAANVVPEGGRLLVVFGCGGDRDPSKRPQMGEIAESLATEVYVTSDNPRSEDPEHIIASILAGIHRMKNVKVEADRATAIRMAVTHASEKDVVVVAGKGHENYQILADRVIPFDDRTEVLDALNSRHSAQGRLSAT
jgi:UDP-N-acetylmuramoyl-L-alanyl-D-glutamate--2,6-diaminopimelate ligase